MKKLNAVREDENAVTKKKYSGIGVATSRFPLFKEELRIVLTDEKNDILALSSNNSNRKYLVNMRHIKKLQCNEVVIENGLKLPVSEKNYREIKRAYLLWKGAQTWNT